MSNRKITKEEAIKAFKEALKHKKEALERTEKMFASEGIKEKVVCV